MISEILSKYRQCIIFGRDSMLIAIFITMFLGCIVRGHHLFMVGFDIITLGYSTTSTTIIAIPTQIGIKIFNRSSTIRTGVFYLPTSILFILGSIHASTFGGFTGPIPANCIIDTLSHDTYFVVGHPIMFLV